MNLKVSDLIIKFLEKLNVNFIFGIPGSQTCPLYDSLYSSSIRHILVRHEQSASYMADAYAKFTGKPGVCDGTGGPGATNLLTGVATAWTDSSPVIVFTGQQPMDYLGRGAFQELDHVALFSPITKWSTRLIKPDKAIETLREAFKTATWGRPGPAHIDLPYDVQNQPTEYSDEVLSKEASRILSPPKSCGDPKAIDLALGFLVKSSKPIIIAGGGVHYSSRACGELMNLAEYLEIPVAMTFNGRGSFPEDHPLSVGRIGIHAPYFNDRILAEADLILAVGCRFAALSTRWWTNINPNALLIHVDVDPRVIGRNYPVELGIVGDAGKILAVMIEKARSLQDLGKSLRREWIKFIEFMKEDWRGSELYRKTFSEETPLKPQRVCAEIRKSCDRKTVFTLDAGNNKLWASTFLEIYEPYTWIQSGCFGPMGYALPAAIACKLAISKEDRYVVAICGDGGFYMSMHELSTAVQEETPVLVCVFNDGALGTIKHHQKSIYDGRLISVSLKNPSFADIAEAFGCVGVSVDKPQQLRLALEDGLRSIRKGETVVLDIKIDGEERLPP
ncbi:thiamine pyrophosphate-binding protein [Candidatus Bathyarchaeota archaeon]|nr:thiamine pyrophosphate-binding protein [Candidatus Bathyarchaeota archaeon]